MLLCCRVSGILGAVPSFKSLNGSTNDDWIDRMSHVWTVVLLCLFALVVSTSQFVGDPIHCWCPAQFSGAWESYTKSYCWIANTYYIPMSDTIPVDINTRQDREITYYQWVPLILLFQAFMFKFPNLVWRIFNSGSGLNLDKIVDLAEQTQMGSPEDRKTTIEHLAKFMDKWLDTHREYKWNVMVRMKARMSRVCCFFCNKRAGTFFTALYLSVKVMYMANVISQFFLLNAFMATDYNLFGFEVIDYLTKGGIWIDSPRFPRVTLCDFEIRQLQNLQRWTVQCVLPINLFNEKIFIFLWFWFVFVAALSAFNLLNWIFLIMIKRNRVEYTKKYLKINADLQTGFDKKLCHKFADTYLRDDGVFVLRVVSKNSTDLVVTDLVHELWLLFKEKQSTHKNNREPAIDEAKEPLDA